VSDSDEDEGFQNNKCRPLVCEHVSALPPLAEVSSSSGDLPRATVPAPAPEFAPSVSWPIGSRRKSEAGTCAGPPDAGPPSGAEGCARRPDAATQICADCGASVSVDDLYL